MPSIVEMRPPAEIIATRFGLNQELLLCPSAEHLHLFIKNFHAPDARKVGPQLRQVPRDRRDEQLRIHAGFCAEATTISVNSLPDIFRIVSDRAAA